MLTIASLMMGPCLMTGIVLYILASNTSRGWSIPWALGGAGVTMLISVMMVSAMQIDAPLASWTLTEYLIISMIPPALGGGLALLAMLKLGQPIEDYSTGTYLSPVTRTPD